MSERDLLIFFPSYVYRDYHIKQKRLQVLQEKVCACTWSTGACHVLYKDLSWSHAKNEAHVHLAPMAIIAFQIYDYTEKISRADA